MVPQESNPWMLHDSRRNARSCQVRDRYQVATGFVCLATILGPGEAGEDLGNWAPRCFGRRNYPEICVKRALKDFDD